MQTKDYSWFLENYPQLSNKYKDKYIAVKNMHILGSYSSYAEAVHETAKTEPLGSFIVQLCNGKESAYTNFISSVNLL